MKQGSLDNVSTNWRSELHQSQTKINELTRSIADQQEEIYSLKNELGDLREEETHKNSIFRISGSLSLILFLIAFLFDYMASALSIRYQAGLGWGQMLAMGLFGGVSVVFLAVGARRGNEITL